MLPFWIRRLRTVLQASGQCRSIILKHNRLSVRYKSGFHRTYIFKPVIRRHLHPTNITPEMSAHCHEIPIEWQCLPHHFRVLRREITKGSYIDREILLHKLLALVSQSGAVYPYYDDHDIAREMERILQADSPFLQGQFCPYRDIQGWPIVPRFFDIWDLTRHDWSKKSFHNAFKRPGLFYKILYRLIHHSKYDIDYDIIYRKLRAKKYGPRWVSPVIYKVLFQQLLRPQGRIIADDNPAFGSKAIAACMVGASYLPLNNALDHAMGEGFGAACGVTLASPPSDGKYDVLLFDNGFRTVDIDRAMSFRDRARTLVVFVRRWQYEQALLLNPVRTVPVTISAAAMAHYQPEWLFFFGSM
jgi:hypothetical protein